MSLEFIKRINEYISESVLEAEDQEILSCIDSPSYPSNRDIAKASKRIQIAIQDSKRRRLAEKKAAFAAHKASQQGTSKRAERRTASAMIADIAKALQNSDSVPEGILLAFREQQDNASDEDIERIWQSLVDLGLIDPDEKDSKP